MGRDLTPVESAFNGRDYPTVFGLSANLIGMPRLLQPLRGVLDAHRNARPQDNIYDQNARWPMPVYMTTNYDHEIHRHLAATGEASYIEYSNSEDHLSFLLPDTTGAIVHLHGDLRSEAGLILTAEQYPNIASGPEWQHWRTKLTSIFQMNPVIVVGHSLMDPHVRHVLEAAKKGAGVAQPVCWIAPDVHPATVKEYLEKYRIRVVSYDNRDGTHRNLVRLVEQISDFVPPRLSNAWFISQTAILNTICSRPKITWHPETFIRFANTLAPASDQDAAGTMRSRCCFGRLRSQA